LRRKTVPSLQAAFASTIGGDLAGLNRTLPSQRE